MLIKFETIEKVENSQKTHDEGRYDAKIINFEEKVSQSGNEYIRLTYETIGENVFTIKANYFPNSEKALSIFLNVLSAIGLYDKDSKKDLNIDKNDILGQCLNIELIKGEPADNGVQYLEVKPWSAQKIDEDVLPF